MTTVTFTHDQHVALAAAIIGGALAARQAQLTELLRANRDHPSIAANIEREIVDLEAAGHQIVRSL